MRERPTAGRVVLTGSWPGTEVDVLAAACTLVDAAATACPHPVDWLLAVSGPDGPAAVHALAAGLRAAGSPRLRIAVVDPGGRWPADGYDIYLGGAADPREVVAALWLHDRGFRVGRPPPGRPAAHSPLTVREDELLRRVCAGLGNDRIARELRISRSTVEFHLTRIFRKLGVHSRAEAIVHATGPFCTCASGV
ncbi:helix-turn-helix transcriptional regulator [Actinoplanes sp. G11-F43]|uniref:helix-turn-helix transcriptional regulator n=1 Tax=Actinoplanes sp. G11-F43 TaxID=3424130 RepID=UPI003D330983